MGREVKRVPLSFDWPLSKVWEGYLNPFHKLATKCPHCENGYSPEYTRLESLWYSHMGGGFKPEDRGSIPYLPEGQHAQAWAKRQCTRSPEFYGGPDDPIAIQREAVRICAIWNSSWSHHLNEADIKTLVKGDRLHDFTHQWVKGKTRGYWRKRHPERIPTPREVNDWSLFGMGHDSINSWIVIKAECKRHGWPTTCAHCKGTGEVWSSRSARLRYARWKPKEPPAGEAFQVWETVSEGSPISPPFATPEELATYMAGTRWGADQGTLYETWLAFIRGPGWAPSMMTVPGKGLVSGVEAVVANQP